MSKRLLSPPNLEASVCQQPYNVAYYPCPTPPRVVVYPLQGALCSALRHQHLLTPHKKCGTTSPSNPFHSEGQPSTKSFTTPPCWQSLPSVTLSGLATSWLGKWSHQRREGLLLQAAEPWPDKEFTRLRIDADTGCLRLLSLLFDSKLLISNGIKHWRHCMACCEYRLCPTLVSDS